jgi:hypothetical protein
MLTAMPRHKTPPLSAGPPPEVYNVRTKISKEAEIKLLQEQLRRRMESGTKVPLMDIAQELLEAALRALPPYPPQ